MDIAKKLQSVENLLKEKRTEEAKSALKELYFKNKEDQEVTYWIGVCSKLEGDLEKAERAFRKVISKDANHYKSLYGLGLILENKGNLEEALNLYRSAVLINPNYKAAIQKLHQHGIQAPDTESEISDKEKTNQHYATLESLLKKQEWKKADRETTSLLNEFYNGFKKRQKEINAECDTLTAIDKLWNEYSQGRFGFSVQKKIYKNVGGLISLEGNDPTTFDWFIKRIGWNTNKKINFKKSGAALKGLNNISYSLSAPYGHLPADWVLKKKDLLIAKHNSFFSTIFFFIIYACFAIGIFGAIGGIIAQHESGLIIGAIAGFIISLQIPVAARRQTKESKIVSEAQRRMMKCFYIAQECGL